MRRTGLPPRSAVLAALAFLGLLGLHYLVSGIVPSPAFPMLRSPGPEVRRFFAENQSEIRALSAVDVVAASALLGFVGVDHGMAAATRPE